MGIDVKVRPLSPAPVGAYPADMLLSRLIQITDGFTNVAFASSLGAEDMVVTDSILSSGLPIAIFTLDTGRLPRETLALLDRIHDRYRHQIDVFRPNADEVAGYVFEHGENAFYESV